MSASAAMFQIPAEGAGVSVFQDDDAIRVTMPYNSVLTRMIRKINGAGFDKDTNEWVIPLNDTANDNVDIPEVITAIRAEAQADQLAREDIDRLAHRAAVVLQDDKNVKPMISDFHERDTDILGKIIAANSHYVAQFTGNGSQDGAAFVTLHRRSDLDVELFNGDHAVVKYGDKGRATAKKYLPAAEREAEFDKNLGKSVDGVTVRLQGDKYLVEFDYNEALSDRIRKVDSATFNRESKVWEVGSDRKEFIVRAVSDMRQEVIADRADRQDLEVIASKKIGGAIVKDAFTKEGSATTGEVFGQNSRYVLQHTGKEYTALHRVGKLDGAVRNGQNVRIEYGDSGKAQVTDKSKSKSQER